MNTNCCLSAVSRTSAKGVLMQSGRLTLGEAVWICIVLLVCLVSQWPACAALESGVYGTVPGSFVEERGDRGPNGSRVVPFSATVTLDLSGAQPSLTAEIPNAVLEGGDPFSLTVHSESGYKLMEGTYRFTGDYLQEIYPSGTQYLFDWRCSPSTNGQVLWDGITGWAGGHIWQITITNIVLVPQAWLSISRVGLSSIQIAWETNFS